MPFKAAKLEKLLEAVPDALVGMDQKGVVRFVNRQTEALFDYDRDQLIGRPIETLVPEPLWQIYAQNRDEYFSDPRTRSSGLELELTGRRRDGTEFPINISMAHIDTGDVLLVITAVADVTRHQVAIRNAQLLAAIVYASDDAIIGTTLEGVITSWNPAAERMYGYTDREIIGRSGSILATVDQASEIYTLLAKTQAGEVIEHLEVSHRRKDGSVVPISLTVAPITDENGTVVGSSAVARDVTGQRKAFEAAQRLAAIVRGSEDAIFGSTLDGTITSWNKAAEALFGYTAKELIGKSGRRLSPRGHAGEMRALLAKIGAGQHIEHLETLRVRKDGTLFPASLTVSPIRNPGGVVVGASAILRDVTEQRKASETAQQMEALVEYSEEAIVSLSPDGIITSWNPAAEEMYGYSSEEVVGKPARLLLPEDRAGELFDTLARVKDGQVLREDSELPRKDGTPVPVSITLSPIRDVDCEVAGVVSIHRDMTSQRRALEAAQRLAAVIESADDAILTGSLDGIITSWNPAAERLYGYSRKEIVGESIQLLIPDDRRDETEQILAEIGTGRHRARLETVRVRKDGTTVPVSVTVSPIRDPAGAVVATSAVHHDMTAHMLKLEAAQRLAAIVSSSEDAIIGETLEGVITSWNPAAEAMFGYTSQETVGQPVDILIPQDQAERTREIVAKVSTGQRVEHLKTFNVRKDGTVFPISLTVSPLHDLDGAITGASVTCRDVSEQEHAAQYARSLVEADLDPLITIRPGGRINDVNEAAVNLTGVPRDQLIGTEFSRYFTDPGKAREGYERVFAQGSITDFPLTVRHRDGTLADLQCHASVYRDSRGEVLGVLASGHDVTEQKKAFEAAQRMEAIVESSNDAITSGSLDGTITSWNPAAERMYGYSSAEIIGKPAKTLTPADRRGEIRAILAKISKGQRVEHFETTRLRKDGSAFPVSLSVSPVRNADGTVVGTSVIHHDLTGQKGALADAQRIAAIVQYSGDAIISRTIDGTITSWNPAAERMFGYSSKEIVGKSIGLLIPEDRAGEMISILAKISAGKTVTDFETTRLRKDGTAVTVSLTVSPHRNEAGTVVGASVIFRDVTELKHAAEYSRSLIETALDPLLTISPAGKITDVNEATVKVTGVPRHKLIGTDFSGYFTDPDKAHEGYERAFEQESVTDYPLTLRHRDGTLTDVLYNASVYRSSAGEVLGVFAAARDVTQQRKAFEAAQRVTAIVENSDEAIIGITLDGHVTSWNPAAERMFGHSSETIVGRSVDLLSPEDRVGEITATLARAGRGQPAGLQTICVRHDGTTLPVKLTVAPIRDADGAIVGTSAIALDLTEAT